MNQITSFAIILASFVASAVSAQQPAIKLFDAIKPALSLDTVAVLNIDLKNVSLGHHLSLFRDESNKLAVVSLNNTLDSWEQLIADLVQNGAEDLTILFRLGTFVPQNRIAIVRCDNQNSAEKVLRLIKEDSSGWFNRQMQIKVVRELVVASQSNAGRANWVEQCADQPAWWDLMSQKRQSEFSRLLGSVKSPVRFAFALSGDQKRALSVFAPSGGGNWGMSGVQSITAGIDFRNRKIEFLLDAEEISTASQIGDWLQKQLQRLADRQTVKSNLPMLASWLNDSRAAIKIDGRKIQLTIKEERFNATMQTFVDSVCRLRPFLRYKKSAEKMRLIAEALHDYHDCYGAFPPAYTVDDDGKPLHNWRVLILPFMEQNALYKQFKLNEPWNSPHNLSLARTVPSVYESGQGTATRFQSVLYGVLNSDERRLPRIADGSGQTIAIVETAPSAAIHWTEPDKISAHSTELLDCFVDKNEVGFLVAVADGTVRYVSKKIGNDQLRALLLPADGDAFHWSSQSSEYPRYTLRSEFPKFWFESEIPELWVIGGLGQ